MVVLVIQFIYCLLRPFLEYIMLTMESWLLCVCGGGVGVGAGGCHSRPCIYLANSKRYMKFKKKKKRQDAGFIKNPFILDISIKGLRSPVFFFFLIDGTQLGLLIPVHRYQRASLPVVHCHPVCQVANMVFTQEGTRTTIKEE